MHAQSEHAQSKHACASQGRSRLVRVHGVNVVHAERLNTTLASRGVELSSSAYLAIHIAATMVAPHRHDRAEGLKPLLDQASSLPCSGPINATGCCCACSAVRRPGLLELAGCLLSIGRILYFVLHTTTHKEMRCWRVWRGRLSWTSRLVVLVLELVVEVGLLVAM
jgi:hypothetical protein